MVSSASSRRLLSGSRNVWFAQLTCGAAASCSVGGCRDVWLLSSDGATSHLCLLRLEDEPIVAFNAAIPACSAVVTCIAAAPGSKRSSRSAMKRNDRKNEI